MLLPTIATKKIDFEYDAFAKSEYTISYQSSKNSIYHAFDDYIKKRATSFTVNVTVNPKYTSRVIKSYFQDIAYRNSYFYGTLKSYSTITSSSKSGKTKITVNITYTLNQSQQEMVDHEIEKITKKIIKPSMSDFQKVAAINQYIVDHTKYSDDSHPMDSDFTPYGVFFNQKAVCQGYATATTLLLNKAGITNYYVTGRTKDNDHAWNKVKVSGKWYNLDTTFNDPYAADGYNLQKEDINHFAYFLVNDSLLHKEGRTWDQSQFPKAIVKKFNFLNTMRMTFVVGDDLFFLSSDGSRLLSKYDIKANTITQLSSLPVDKITFNHHYVSAKIDNVIYKLKSSNHTLTKIEN